MSELYSGLITHGVLASGHMRGSQPAVSSPTEAGMSRGDKQRTTDAGVPCAHALWMMATRGAVREVRVPRRSQVTPCTNPNPNPNPNPNSNPNPNANPIPIPKPSPNPNCR